MNEMKEKRSYCRRMRRANLRCGVWAVGWTLSQALATFGGKLWWPEAMGLKVAAISLNGLVGIGMVLSLKRFLGELDELHRRIQLEALALTVGLGVVMGMSYATLDQVDVIRGDAEIGHLVIFMSLTYAVSVLAGNRRYR